MLCRVQLTPGELLVEGKPRRKNPLGPARRLRWGDIEPESRVLLFDSVCHPLLCLRIVPHTEDGGLG